MNNAKTNTKPLILNPKSGICGICGLLLFVSCFRLDSFLFDPSKVTDYLNPADMDSSWHVRFIIPDSLVEPVTLTALDGNHIYGFFVRQPAEGDCPRMRTFPGSPTDYTEGVRSQSAESAESAKSADNPPENQVTVIYNHGNGQNINRYWGRVELLWEVGFKVFIYDYEGFGKSEGTPSGDACYADAQSALDYVLARPDVDDTLVVYYGWSLGSFMACHLAAEVRHPSCLILENPMASTSALAKEGAVLEIPGSFVADADFDNEARIPFVGCRTLIIYGKNDDTAVPKRNAEVLLSEARGWIPITGYPVENANHADLPEVMTYPEYERVVSAFIAGDSL
ncbi:MAG: alpha/beta fold hydrolase [candidate division WOR-3 bacterium]|nr:alpha/beta fold hydrolase [candidate division WOR-3 bacterium]